MAIDILRAELERLFELDELLALSRELLGFDPDQIGGTTGKGSFVRALTDVCLERDAVEALCDAVIATKSNAGPELVELSTRGLSVEDELAPGQTLGPVSILRKLGEGTASISYHGKEGEEDRRIKVLKRAATRDRRSVYRFLTLTRLAKAVEHEALPTTVTAGMLGDRAYVAHDYVEGQPLSVRIARTGPMHINEARELLKAILGALDALHASRIAHGNLKLENVLIARDADGQKVRLLDPGGDRLRSRAPANGHIEVLSVSSPATIAPEQVRGSPATAESDIYSFGALLFQILTGKPLFSGSTMLDTIVAHLASEPRAPSTVAPRGWVPRQLDDFVLSLLEKDPAKRPRSIEALRESLEEIARPRPAVEPISEADLAARIEAVVADPANEEAALALEAATNEGAEAARVAQAFRVAADALEPGDDETAEELTPEERETQRSVEKGLLYRAGRLYEQGGRLEDAERIFAKILDLDPAEHTAQSKLEALRRQLGKYEELIEALLERAENAQDPPARAEAMARIGQLYAEELEDPEQALVAYTQAFCEDPSTAEYAIEIEKLAGESRTAWEEVLGTCTEKSTEELPPEAKIPLFEKMGRWYAEHYARPDLALACFQAMLATDPANEAALEGLTTLYRKSQQWSDLGMALMRRADAVADPARARDLRCEAAELLENQLNDPAGARDVYTQVLADDPGHAKAGEALGRLAERAGDYATAVKILERQAEALRGDEKNRVLCRIAEVYEDRLGDDAEAIRRLTAVVEEAPDDLQALVALDRLYSKAGRFNELLENLSRQLDLATTPRQKITLLERIASVKDEEFLDHQGAAEALERVLQIDPSFEPALSEVARHYRALERWGSLADLYERHQGHVTDDKRRLELALARARVLGDQLGETERAIEAYEKVLEIDPENAPALESLARLRETAGQEDAALDAIETLAERAETPEARAEQYVRAAGLLKARGDRDGAIDRYKRALDATPTDTTISAALRAAYVDRGDVNAAVDLLEKEIDQTEGDRQKAKLCAELAALCRDRLEDDERAERAARRALDHDPTNTVALTLLADIAFDAKRFVEASAAYDKLAGRTETLEHDEAVRVLIRFVDSLAKGGSTEKALAPMDTLLRLAPDSAEALQRVAAVTFEHGSAKRARELHADLLARFGDHLSTDDKAEATYRLGEASRLSGDLDSAITELEEAADLNPARSEPLIALAKAYETQERWDRVVDAKQRHLDLAEGDERVRLLIEVGELAATRLDDRTLATKSLVAALDERPDDRRLLMRLMQLYSEEKDWSKLVDIVVKLADFVDDEKQKAKYLQTAAMVTGREMADFDRALTFYARVRELDPSNDTAVDESIALLKDKGDYAAAVEMLKDKAKAASEAKRNDRMLEAFNELGVLYKDRLGRIGHAIDAYEAAQTLDPDNQERNELLAELYASNPERYLEKAVAAQMVMLAKNPYREQSYKLLRRLYTESKRADPAWCLCQALYVLKLAEPDEERFFRRMRSEDPAYAQAVVNDENWLELILHADADPLLTTIFALIEPAVIATRCDPLEKLGYDPRYAIDPGQHPFPLSQTLFYAAGVLGMDCPVTFENPNDPAGLSFLHASTPSIVLGRAALTQDIPPQAAAFIAARHLTYFRPGLYLRHLVPFGTGLKSWLFAAIKMNTPQFPVAADIDGPVREATAALEQHLSPASRDQLSRVVSRLLQSGRALDLKRWVQGVDLTADRVGFALCHDLETAVEIIRASDEGAASVAPQTRLKELVLYGISEPYFALRERLGITIDS